MKRAEEMKVRGHGAPAKTALITGHAQVRRDGGENQGAGGQLDYRDQGNTNTDGQDCPSHTIRARSGAAALFVFLAASAGARLIAACMRFFCRTNGLYVRVAPPTRQQRHIVRNHAHLQVTFVCRIAPGSTQHSEHFHVGARFLPVGPVCWKNHAAPPVRIRESFYHLVEKDTDVRAGKIRPPVDTWLQAQATRQSSSLPQCPPVDLHQRRARQFVDERVARRHLIAAERAHGGA